MKKVSRSLLLFVAGLLLTGISITGCKKKSSSPSVSATNYEQVNLVADTTGYNASRTDVSVVNAWGIAFNPSGSVQVMMNHSGISESMDANGNILGSITIKASAMGVVYNYSTAFLNTVTGTPASFIYLTQNGIMSMPTLADTILTVVNQPASVKVYTGLTMAGYNGANYLFATDIYNGIVDVYDDQFNLYAHNARPFSDPQIPSGYVPFNVQNINGSLYVTYAKQGAGNTDVLAGAGLGYVDIFSTAGVLVKRFASQGTLNAPWGIAQAPSGFSEITGAILIGNYGDGHINVFDTSGNYKGQLESNGSVIAIDGLRAIAFPPSGAANFTENQLYFSAAPGGETHGLFGYIKII